MRKSKFSEEQIIAILAEQERGMAKAEVCRRHGVSSASFFKLKYKFGGMDVPHARRATLCFVSKLATCCQEIQFYLS